MESEGPTLVEEEEELTSEAEDDLEEDGGKDETAADFLSVSPSPSSSSTSTAPAAPGATVTVATSPMPTVPENAPVDLSCESLLQGGRDAITKEARDAFKSVTPRPHQLDCVVSLVAELVKPKPVIPTVSLPLSTAAAASTAAATAHTIPPAVAAAAVAAAGSKKSSQQQQQQQRARNFLIQHAAGSGKSLTIAALACMLCRLVSGGHRKFEKIIIINDRTHLDAQLGDCVCRLLLANGLTDFVRVRSVQSLQNEISSSRRIIITTLQKFAAHPRAGKTANPLALLGTSPTALISDEAHRSYGAQTSRRLHELLTGNTKQSANLTYFAFTSTPSARTLEMFGDRSDDRLVRPFHTFTFAQALQSNLIVDVLKNYISVPANLIIQEAEHAEAVKFSDGKRAAQHLIADATQHVPLLTAKADYIVKHLLAVKTELDTQNFHTLGMLVVRTRKHIIWYTRYLRHMIESLDPQLRFGIIAAFSPFIFEGKKQRETDTNVNGDYALKANAKYGIVQAIREPNSDVRLIVVADKLQTGFDEPRLSALYLDRLVRGASVVQTLGRLSRTAPEKREVYVVDFVNKREDISAACSMYWGVATLKKPPSVEVLQNRLSGISSLLRQLDGFQEADMEKAKKSLDTEESNRKRVGGRSLNEDLLTFLRLCNKLQVDGDAGITYEFISKLRDSILAAKRIASAPQLNALTEMVTVQMSLSSSPVSGKIVPAESSEPFTAGTRRRGRAEQEMLSSEVITLANLSLSLNQSSDLEFASTSPPSEGAVELARKLWTWSEAEKQKAMEKMRGDTVMADATQPQAAVPQAKPLLPLAEAVQLLREPKDVVADRKRALSALFNHLPGERGQRKVLQFLELGGARILIGMIQHFAAATFGLSQDRETAPNTDAFVPSAPHLSGAIRLLTICCSPEHGACQHVQSLVLQEQAMQHIVSLLQPPDPSQASLIANWPAVQSVTARCITLLCFRNPRNRRAAIDAGAVEHLLKLLEGDIGSIIAQPSPSLPPSKLPASAALPPVVSLGPAGAAAPAASAPPQLSAPATSDGGAAQVPGTPQRGQQLSSHVAGTLATLGYDPKAASKIGTRGTELITRFLLHKNVSTIACVLDALVAVATADETLRNHLRRDEFVKSKLHEIAFRQDANLAVARASAASLRCLLYDFKTPARFQPRVPPKKPKTDD